MEGGNEKRTCFLSYKVNCIHDKKKWKTVKGIGKMTVEKTINDKKTVTNYYYILSGKLGLESFIGATRSHWNIECSLHWKLDVILDEDHSTNKKGNSIDNISIVRKIVYNLAQLDSSMGNNLSLKKKITRYALNFDNIENLIFFLIPAM
ncbi:MAG: ISAs1 family transposase [Candidatus Riflebacteria bacterium]|nr:ISAs1 family transposase [Candidatus Riflebacteria bacterium]